VPLVRPRVKLKGSPHLAGDWLECVQAPTLPIVGALDRDELRLNEAARERLYDNPLRGTTYSAHVPGGE
jgi:hypothetical protein